MKKEGIGALRVIFILIALAVLAYSGWNLYQILDNYRQADKAYEDVNRDYTTKTGTTLSEIEIPDVIPKYEDGQPPMEVDWEALRQTNKDIVAWICFEADNGISFPVCWRKGDDDYYLHRSYTGEYLYAGAIFLEGENNPDFADPISIVYGHNMKNGGMFAPLKKFKDQRIYDKNPFFWILTPAGNYRYHIYSVFTTEPYSEVYQLFALRGNKFKAWEETMRSLSDVENTVPFFTDDSSVVLSTCESDHEHRNVVIGRCVSTQQPVRTSAEYVSKGTKGNTLNDLQAEEGALAPPDNPAAAVQTGGDLT